MVAVLAVLSCVLGEEGGGRCTGCLIVCARGRGRWSLYWLSNRVCYGKEGAGRCTGCLIVCARGRGRWSLYWLSNRVC